MTWERLVELEPRLLVLYKRALALRQSGREFDLIDVWGGPNHGMKDDMKGLVGPSATKEPSLGIWEAYDIAYDKIYFEAMLGETIEVEDS